MSFLTDGLMDWSGVVHPLCERTDCPVILVAEKQLKENTSWCNSKVRAAKADVAEAHESMRRIVRERDRMINNLIADHDAELARKSKAQERAVKDKKKQVARRRDTEARLQETKAELREIKRECRDLRAEKEKLSSENEELRIELAMYRGCMKSIGERRRSSDKECGNYRKDTGRKKTARVVKEDKQTASSDNHTEPAEAGSRRSGASGSGRVRVNKTASSKAKSAPASEGIAAAEEEVRTSLRNVQHLVDERMKLKQQVERDYKDSGITSRLSRNRGVVHNGRVKTGKSQGGQPGHPGHCRKDQEVTEDPIEIQAEDRILEDPDWYETGEEIRKKVVGIKFSLCVREYVTKVYRNRRDKRRYHAPFPPNCVNELNYDETIKALIFYLRDEMKVSEQHISDFFAQVSDGKLQLSRGMINDVNKQFAKRTKEERQKIFDTLKAGEILYVDLTTVRVNGKQMNIVVCTDKNAVWYGFREHKGEKAIEGTPYENFGGIGVHDHEAILIKHAEEHQECLVHILRYLLRAEYAEPDLTWHRKMGDLLVEMNEVREKQGRKLTEAQIADFERRYDEMLEIGRVEYEEHPPRSTFTEGFNLNRRMHEKESYLRFLRDERLDFSNNISERCLRLFKRLMSVMGSFRGKGTSSPEAYCDALTVYESLIKGSTTVLEGLEAVFRTEPARTRSSSSGEPEGNPAEEAAGTTAGMAGAADDGADASGREADTPALKAG